MNKNIFKEKKGVAGLNVYLSLIAMLFMIGIIVMVFQIAGSKLQDSVKATSTSADVTNETQYMNATLGYLRLSKYNLDSVACTIGVVTNASDGVVISSGNWTQTNCYLYNATSTYSNRNWNVSYSYTYLADSDAGNVINDTRQSIKDATDFFPTFIVLGAMVVLVLLVVVIINSIRSTGITQEGA